MSGSKPNPPASSGKSPAQLNKIGMQVLICGVVIAGLIYLVFPGQNAPDDSSLASQYYKSEEIQTQQMWGNEGSLVLGITRSLRHAGTWSVIVLAVSTIVSFVFFYLASHPKPRH